MRVSTKMTVVGIVVVLLGFLSQIQPTKSVVTIANAPELTELPVLTQLPDTTPVARLLNTDATRTLLPVTVLPTATPVVFPTAQHFSSDTVLTNANIYQESFTDTRSGWEPYYAGAGGAWNGYGSARYAFQLANDANLVGGRRLWDFNTCCVLDPQYQISVEAQSQTPQRGMVITEYVGNFVDMQTASGIVVLFEVGYNMQPRPRPIQIVMLQQGFLSELNCVGDTDLTVGTRMKINVTVVNGLLVVELINREVNQQITVKCGLNNRTPDRKLLGIGAVRAEYSENQAMTPLEYTNLEMIGIDRYITDTMPDVSSRSVSAGCGAQTTVNAFEEWLRQDILYSCPAY